jgi:protein associated with RNAse G/E
VHLLGEDEHGTWIWGPSGRTIWRGQEPLFATQLDALVLVVPGAWWSPAWWVNHPEMSVYVDIGTPPVRESGQITSIDLDLDVIRFRDGRVQIVDRDEFELHQKAFAYPSDVIDNAERAANSVLELLTADVAPFDGVAAQRWIDRARAAELPRLTEARPT